MNWVEISSIAFVCGMVLIGLAWVFWYVYDNHTPGRSSKSSLREEIRILKNLTSTQTKEITRLHELTKPVKILKMDRGEYNMQVINALTQRLVAECILDPEFNIYEDGVMDELRDNVSRIIRKAQFSAPMELHAGFNEDELVCCLHLCLPEVRIEVPNF